MKLMTKGNMMTPKRFWQYVLVKTEKDKLTAEEVGFVESNINVNDFYTKNLKILLAVGENNYKLVDQKTKIS